MRNISQFQLLKIVIALGILFIILCLNSCNIIEKARTERKDKKVYNQAITRPNVDAKLKDHYINKRVGYDTTINVITHDTTIKPIYIQVPIILKDSTKQKEKIKTVVKEISLAYNDSTCQHEIHDAFIEGRDYAIEQYQKVIKDATDTIINEHQKVTVQDRLAIDYLNQQNSALKGQILQLKEDKAKSDKKAANRLYIIIGIIAIITGIAGLKLWMKYRPTNSLNPLKLVKR